MDIDMPIKNGYDASLEIKSLFFNDPLSAPYICACSAYKNCEDKISDYGIDQFIEKPINIENFRNLLN